MDAGGPPLAAASSLAPPTAEEAYPAADCSATAAETGDVRVASRTVA
jgi:hypothetical protein